MTSLLKLETRLKKLGIDVVFQGNYPWIYLHKVNGRTVYTKYLGEHGFTAAFLDVKGNLMFPDRAKLFQEIRKHI